MGSVRETLGFALVLAGCMGVFFHETLLGDRILSPADVLLVEASFQPRDRGDYEPFNRLLMDPVLQFQPWLEFNRTMIRQGRLPLWNPYAGCGSPHLACGQSAVFDPFQLIAYLGTVPRALAWMAAGRLWVAGLGMFLLAGSWGCGYWGRWFAGLVYPFCGFLIVWLLYPVTPVAIWLPWLLLASDAVLGQPRARRVGMLAVVVGLVIVGGHIQTSAHVLLAAFLFACWRTMTALSSWRDRGRRMLVWAAGISLGLVLGAAQIIPLACYLDEKSGLGRPPARDKGMVGPVAAPPTGCRMHGLPLYLWQPMSRPAEPGSWSGRAQLERISRRIHRAGHPDLAGASALGRRGRRSEVGFLLALCCLRRNGRVSTFSRRQPAAPPFPSST